MEADNLSDLTREDSGGLIFLRLGGSGVTREERGGSKASSSDEADEGEVSEVGDCFTNLLLRLVTDFLVVVDDGGSLMGLLRRGLLEEVGGA